MVEKIVELKNISKKYSETESPVIKNLSLNLYCGKLYFVCGPSGVGKSTLLHIIGLMDKPSDGEYYLFGNKIEYSSQDKLSKLRIENVGFMFQFHYLIENLTVEENILLPYWMKNKIVNKTKASSLDFVKYLGLENLLSRYPYEISGGEQQRVSLARAIINKPKIILADEPTGNLDYKNAIKMIEMIKDIVNMYNVTVLIATHNIELTKYGDVIINLKDGQVDTIEGDEKLVTKE
ncbi:MAG: ABC transporter ATP-binding protein [Endomicrobiia bacterium]